MKDKDKLQLLKNLDTTGLMKRLHDTEDALEEALRDEASYKNLNFEYIASGTSDCQAVKAVLAELSVQVPEADVDGKKYTAPQKEQWLVKQRVENPQLQAEINKQQSVDFLIDNNRIKSDMAKRRLEGAKGELALKTAQLNFLAS